MTVKFLLGIVAGSVTVSLAFVAFYLGMIARSLRRIDTRQAQQAEAAYLEKYQPWRGAGWRREAHPHE